MESTPRMPVALRSSVSMAILLLIASLGWLTFNSFPLYFILPAVWARSPNNPSISSVLCAPTRPATPKISPFFSWKDTWRKLLGLMDVKSSTSNTTSPGVFPRAGYNSESARPTIFVMIKSVVKSFDAHVPMYCPSRMIVTSSLIRSISSILWLIYTMETPFSRSSPIIVNSASTSAAVREEVGSSKISTLQSADTAFAISTSCICDTERLPSFALGSKFK